MKKTLIHGGIVLGLALALVLGTGGLGDTGRVDAAAIQNIKGHIPLKEVKLNIEHNATDEDTGFQGAIDSEGWKNLVFKNPKGVAVLKITGLNEWGELGLTELFFETVEPANADVPIEDMLALLPEGMYAVQGTGIEYGDLTGKTGGRAWLTHDIPEGPVLLLPEEGAEVPVTADVVFDWESVTRTIEGDALTIIAYQLIVEKHTDTPEPHMIGKRGSVSMYLAPSVTRMRIPKEFFEPRTDYDWEVLAIEESGNQTLSSGKFSTN